MSVTQTLSVTEVAGSVNTTANTSRVRILWQSTQSGDSWNGYTRTAKYYISINGGAEIEHSVSYTLPKSSTATIVDTTVTVQHKDDGSGSIKVRTWMDTSISAGVVEKTQNLNLTTIPRASTISTVLARTLGEACYVKWTPMAQSFRYKLKFSLGGFSYTTGVIHPNIITAYTYTQYTIPIDVARQLPNSKTGTMTVTLYTYSDSGATSQVGSASSATFTVTVPESTKPSLTMTLSPVTPYTSLSSVYLQGRSNVKAAFTGSGQLGASIVSYSMRIGNKTYSSPYTSEILATSGEIEVVGIATDSRGYTASVTQNITVSAYDKPSIVPYTGASKIICARCLSDGTLDGGGTYLLVKIGRRYSKVISGGKQNNFCTLSYSYKTDAQDVSKYSTPTAIIPGSADGDYVSVILPNVVSSNTTAYNIRLIAEDTAGEKDIVTITIPTAFVTFHAPVGGHGFTLGGYHDPSKYDVFDCKFDAEFEGVVKGNVWGLVGSSGNIPSGSDLNEYHVPGVYAINYDDYAQHIANCPSIYAGLLRVYASTGQTHVIDGAYIYLTQEYTPYKTDQPIYRRQMRTDAEGIWRFEEWIPVVVKNAEAEEWIAGVVKDTETLQANSGISKIEANIYTANGVEVFQFVIRQGSNYHVINFSPSGIEYGKNGGVYWKK